VGLLVVGLLAVVEVYLPFEEDRRPVEVVLVQDQLVAG
jgi:hypothetical protein